MAGENLIDILKSNDEKSFFTMFDSVEKFATFRDDNNDNNIFHLISNYSDNTFAKSIYDHYAKENKGLTDALLTKKNSFGKIPAYFSEGEITSFSRLAMLNDEEIRKHDTFVYLKEITKPLIAETTPMYKKGRVFDDGIPLSSVKKDGDKGFETFFPMAPDIFVVKYNEENKKDETFNNFAEDVFYKHDKNKKLGTNYGYFVRLTNHKMNDDLNDTLKKSTPFASEYDFAKATLSALNTEFKRAFNNEYLQVLYERYNQKGGTILVENRAREFVETNAKTTEYTGAFEYQRKNPTIALNTASNLNVAEVLTHELVHANDEGFSDLPIARYATTLLAFNSKKSAPVTMAVNKVAQTYFRESFCEETLAYIFDTENKDGFSKAYTDLYINFVKAKIKNDTAALSLISNFDKTMANKNEIDNCEKLLSENRMNVTKITNRPENIESLSDTFLLELNSLNSQLGKNLNDENKKVVRVTGYHSKDEVTKVLNDTKIEIAGKSIDEMNALLRNSLNKAEASALAPLDMFKVGVVMSAIKDKVFSGKSSEKFPFSFYSEKDFQFNTDGGVNFYSGEYFDNKNLLKYANRLNRTVNLMKTNPNISNEALWVSLNTLERAKDINIVIDDVHSKMKNLTPNASLELFKTELKRREHLLTDAEPSKNDVANIVGLLEIAKITKDRVYKKFNLSSYNEHSFDPVTIDKNNQNAFLGAKIYRELLELSKTPIYNFNPEKSYVSGGKAKKVLSLPEKSCAR